MPLPLGSRWNLSRWAIAHPRLTVGLWIGVALAGLLALSSLQYGLFPEVSFPVVIVQAQGETATAEETERLLTIPLEAPLLKLEDATLYASSYPGQTVISAAFSAGGSLTEATERVKTALANQTVVPADSLKIIPLDLNESVAATYALGSQDLDLAALGQWARETLIPSLETLPGVLTVNLLGDGNFRPSDSGTAPALNPPTLARFQGQDVLAVQVVKAAAANTLEVAKLTAQRIETLQRENSQIALTLAESQAPYIREAVTATLEALGGAVILAILVIYPFLRSWRATLISALAIPLSLLGTFIVMALLGFNLETLTLLALALVIGIVVDDAIVDVENIARHLDAGEDPRTAALNATEEIGVAVTATTLTIVVVFLPIALLGSTLGQFFRPFAITVSAAVIFSLLVARTLSPVLAVWWLRPRPAPVAESAWLRALTAGYVQVLGGSLRRPRTVLALAVLSLAAGLALIPLIPQGFVPSLDRGEFNVVFRSDAPRVSLGAVSPPTQTSTQTDGAFAWVEELAANPQAALLRRGRRVAKKLEPVIAANPEVAEQFTLIGAQGDPLRGRIYLKLKGDRQETTAQVQGQIRENLPVLPRVSQRVEDIPFVQTGDDSPLKLALVGQNLKQLRDSAEKLKAQVETLPGLIQAQLSGHQGEQIERYQGQRAVYLSANLLPEAALGEITAQAQGLAESGFLPPGVELKLQGESARVGLIFGEFAAALLLSLGGMLLIFIAVFRRPLEPIVIALSLPLSIVGALLGLWLTQSDFGMISLIGLIFLLGLLDKNAVLLLEYVNQLRGRGFDRKTALIETGRVRLRPILMTTGSTILGMLPLALGLGAGAELRQPMAVAIIGGLFTSSLLSLIAIPVLYQVLDRGNDPPKRLK
ncbi:MAG: efflux RND transporter permease subunit [Cyanobacteriota bacterium]|nr:efflux RND transporter permease subunit [Cyanobacteriota bacterium]